jgi:uncharacterized protein (DUF305 family)
MMSARWMTSAAALVGVASFLAIAALGVAGCGDDDDSQEAKGNEIDSAFAATMTEHHQLAIEMAEVARQKGESEFVRQLADEIIAAQAAEIETMEAVEAELADAGVQAGDLGVPEHLMGMSGHAADLETAKPFDREFIDMMIPHHQGAIRMARVEQAEGENDELIELAAAIIAAQTREIEEMNAHRQAEFGSSSPAGGAPAEDDTEGAGSTDHEMEGMEH